MEPRPLSDSLAYDGVPEKFAYQGITFDDVLLVPTESDVVPSEVDTTSQVTRSIAVRLPLVSSAMDTVTEARMAIAMALNGGLGLIHYNMTAKDQVKEVARVKRHIHGLIQDPITIGPDQLIGDLLALIEARRFAFSTFPVVDASGKLAGLLSGNVVKDRYKSKKVAEVMTPRAQLITETKRATAKDPIRAADAFFTRNVGINKMLVVDDAGKLRGLVTESDVVRITARSEEHTSELQSH